MSEETRWIISSGREVSVDDQAALEFHPDEIGNITVVHAERGLPLLQHRKACMANRGDMTDLVTAYRLLNIADDQFFDVTEFIIDVLHFLNAEPELIAAVGFEVATTYERAQDGR